MALIGVMDVASREGEMGILRAVGASDLQLSGLQALETLVAALLAGILSDAICARLSDAFNFLVPGILGALWILPLTLGLATAFWLLYLRRREFVLRLE